MWFSSAFHHFSIRIREPIHVLAAAPGAVPKEPET